MRSGKKWRWVFIGTPCILLSLIIPYMSYYGYHGPVISPEELRKAKYTGSESCVDCHESATELWRNSDHAHAMAHATPQTVSGDFSDRTLDHCGVTNRMFRNDGHYYIETCGSDGKIHPYEIKYVLGRQPLQQYLTEFPDGRIQCLPIAWNLRDREWFHLYPNDPVPPSDPLHWTRGAQNWNSMCADCHTTDYRKNYRVPDETKPETIPSGVYESTWIEFGVGCEACHGPGSIHCERANSIFGIPKAQPQFGLVDLKESKPDSQINVCAPCHARRSQVSADLSISRKFTDRYTVEMPDSAAFHTDGQVLSEDFEYTSFIQCRMYHEKVQCTDCHDPHSMTVKFSDNRLCTQCHVAGKYDTEKHHFHKVNDRVTPSLSGELRMRIAERADGTFCVDCHMTTSYQMVCDARPDHSIRVPRPDLTISRGVPNACNLCHFDPAKNETPEWADATCEKWYGKTWSDRKKTPHFAEAIDAGRRGDPKGEVLLTTLLGRADQRPVIRAAALSLLARYRGPAGFRAASDALRDTDDHVRHSAVRAIEFYTPDMRELRSGDPGVR
ncbi:MAG: multiheme c-type cytochrome, partial [Planctomycetia bacterium]|nr:multiheme c-type cytochrome [Planctomycetia bacterium]